MYQNSIQWINLNDVSDERVVVHGAYRLKKTLRLASTISALH